MATRAGRPKNLRPHEIKLSLPKHSNKYKAKRLYWALLEMEKKMSRDITSVKMSEYIALLDAYIIVVEVLRKEGIVYRDSSKRVDTPRDAESDTGSSDSQGVGKDGQADMGTGVRTVNPIT